jgi:hypothetical protein
MASQAPGAIVGHQDRFQLDVGPGNDVGRHQAISHPFAGIGTGPNGRIHRSCFSANHDGDITASYEFSGYQGDFCGLGHGVCRFDRRNQAAGLD